MIKNGSQKLAKGSEAGQVDRNLMLYGVLDSSNDRSKDTQFLKLKV